MKMQVDKKQISLINGAWNKEDNLQAVAYMKEWRVEILCLVDNHRIEVVKDIQHINFTELKTIFLWRNDIQSIEALINLQMPSISNIYLTFNYIRSVRVIRKAMWPEMTALHLHNNFICDSQTLTQGYFPKLSYLWMFYQVEKNKDIFLNPYSMPKVEVPCLFTLGIQCKKLRTERSLLGILKKKWVGAHIN